MGDMDIVDSYDVTTTVYIRRWEMGAVDVRYDWIDSGGRESIELFDSIEEAKRDAEAMIP